MLSRPEEQRSSGGEPPEGSNVVLLGFREDAGLVQELARVLASFAPRSLVLERGIDAPTLVRELGAAKLVLICVARPESTPTDLTRWVDVLLGEITRAVVRVLTPAGTYNGTLMGLVARGLKVIDLGRKLDPRALGLRVATELVAATPLDLPASLYRSALEQRSIELLSENLSLAASWAFQDWQLAQPGDGGRRPNALWSSWLEQTRKPELERLARLLDELRVEELVERSAARHEAEATTVSTPSSFSKTMKGPSKE